MQTYCYSVYAAVPLEKTFTLYKQMALLEENWF